MPAITEEGGDLNFTYLKMHPLFTILISFDVVNGIV
jgi:hypothetical protein